MRILVDMDGVIADFEGEFLCRWQANHKDKPFIPLEERKGFWLREQYPEEYRNHVEEIYHGEGFYKGLPVINGAIEALQEMKSIGHQIFLCTSPMLPKYEHCVLEKYHWVFEKVGIDWVNNIVMTKDKTIIKGDILIDDNPNISGVENPEWEHVLYDQPYNRDDKTKRRLTWENWKEVLKI